MTGKSNKLESKFRLEYRCATAQYPLQQPCRSPRQFYTFSPLGTARLPGAAPLRDPSVSL